MAAVRRWSVPDSTAGFYTLALLAGQTVGNLLFGFLADRFGHKLSLEVGTVRRAGRHSRWPGWRRTRPGTYAVFALMGISFAATIWYRGY